MESIWGNSGVQTSKGKPGGLFEVWTQDSVVSAADSADVYAILFLVQ